MLRSAKVGGKHSDQGHEVEEGHQTPEEARTGQEGEVTVDEEASGGLDLSILRTRCS